jgi:hypothetical protein
MRFDPDAGGKLASGTSVWLLFIVRIFKKKSTDYRLVVEEKSTFAFQSLK